MATAISKASCSMARATEGSQKLRAARESLAAAGFPVPAVEAMARYDWVARVLDGVVRRPDDHRPTTSDRIDAVLTHKIWGTLIFVATMAVLFSSIFVLAVPLMDFIDGGDRHRWPAAWKRCMPEGALRSLVVDGVIGGVGAVVIFLPQILILFFFIALLEDCGYMARAAFLMDRLMAGVGLSGKSFIPLLSSFACAVPGIMATRVIENRRDRLATILIAPLMSCSARLPVYVILIGAFVPAQHYLGGFVGLQGLGAAGDVCGRRDRGDRRCLAAEEDAAARRDAAVRDGAAELQDAVAAHGGVSHGRARLGVSGAGRHGDFRGHDRHLGAGLLSAQRRASGGRHRGPARRDCRTMPRRSPSSTSRRTSTTSRPACTSATAFWAGPASGSSRSCGRSAGIGGSAARRSPRSRPAKS